MSMSVREHVCASMLRSLYEREGGREDRREDGREDGREGGSE